MEEEDNNGWDLPLPTTTDAMAMDVAMLPSPSTKDGDNFDKEGGGQRDKRGGGRTTMTHNVRVRG